MSLIMIEYEHGVILMPIIIVLPFDFMAVLYALPV